MRYAALAVLAALPACHASVWDAGTLDVSVAPAPVATGQTLTVTVRNGTDRRVEYNPCADLSVHATGAAPRQVLPTPDTACTLELRVLGPGRSFSYPFVLAGVAPGTYVVRFAPTLDGGEALAVSPAFEVTAGSAR